jgi:hypothetical protein
MQKRLLLFYSHQQLHSDMLDQPTRFFRELLEIARVNKRRLSACGQFLVCYHTLLVRTQIRNCRVAQDTKGSQALLSGYSI